MDDFDEPHLSHAEVVAIRQAYYEGSSRACLRSGWGRMNQFREEQTHFLGQRLPKPGISQLKIAVALDRNAGEICRWLQGQSPNWAFLMMFMLTVDADWQDLGELPSKRDRALGGEAQALNHIRKTIVTSARSVPFPTTEALCALEALFAVKGWAARRREPSIRRLVIEEVAAQSGIPARVLDAADTEWGAAHERFLDAYGSSIDKRLWR
jgi:hypothetical protein